MPCCLFRFPKAETRFSKKNSLATMQILAVVVPILAAVQVHATVLQTVQNKADQPTGIAPPKGIGDVKDFAALLPFHPRGQQEILMKERCVNFVNHLLETSAYNPAAVGNVIPRCKWSAAECGALQQDLLTRLAKHSTATSLPQGPRGPQPNFATANGMDESIYGWC